MLPLQLNSRLGVIHPGLTLRVQPPSRWDLPDGEGDLETTKGLDASDVNRRYFFFEQCYVYIELWPVVFFIVITHRIHGAAIYGNMDPINIPQMLAYIPDMDPMGNYD